MPPVRKCLLASASLLLLAPSGASGQVDYATQIQPILDNKCAKCHQPARVVDGRKYKPKAGVVLTSTEGIVEAQVIAWGRPDHSLLVQRIALEAGHEDVMPPAKENNAVTPQELELIRTWIKETGGSSSSAADPSKPVPKVNFSSVQSILSSKCYDCHNSNEKPKGGLVLDTIAGIRSSGSVVPGKPDSSELLIRMELPTNDDDVMPPKKTGDKMSQSELTTVRNWILGGAPYGNAGGGEVLEAKVMTANEVLAKGVKQASIAAVQKLSEYGASVTPISAESPMVTVEFISGPAKIGDDFVKELFLIAPNIAELDLSRTSITDASLEHIASFARLTKLNLSNTKVGDEGIAKLVNLKKLDWLNLYGTEVTDAALPSIAKIRSLRTMYFYKSKVTADGLGKLKKAFPSAKIVGDIKSRKSRFDIE